MKSRLLLMVLASLFLPYSLFAQVTTEDQNTKTITEETETPDGKIITTTTFEKQAVFTNGFWYNWELTAGIGPHMYYGENDWKVKNKLEMVAFPVIDVDITKWVSPSFGLGIGISTGRFKGLYQSSEKAWGERSVGANFQTGILYDKADPKYDYMKLALQRGWFTDLYGVFHVDFCNLFGGYNPERVYTIEGYMGGGLMMGHDQNGFLPSAAANFGLLNKFRLNDNLKLSVNVRGALVADDFDGELYVQEPTKEHWDANHKMDGTFGITVGLSVSLGKEHSKWRPASRTSVLHYNEVKIPDTNKNISPEKEIERVVDTVRVSNVPEVWFHVNFELDRWEILSREMVNLNAVADLIKSTPDVRYLICGYADKQTATPEHNLMLSENRSKAVFDALVNTFGVNPEQLVRDYKGGVDYMFYDEKELSRCVMITTIHDEK